MYVDLLINRIRKKKKPIKNEKYSLKHPKMRRTCQKQKKKKNKQNKNKLFRETQNTYVMHKHVENCHKGRSQIDRIE